MKINTMERINESTIKTTMNNPQGIGEVYAFGALLTAKGKNKASGYQFTPIDKAMFTIADKGVHEYNTLIDNLQHALYDGKGGVSQLQAIIAFLGIEADAKKLIKHIITKRVNVNAVDRENPLYTEIEKYNEAIKAAEVNAELSEDERKEAIKAIKTELATFKAVNPVYKTVSVFQLPINTFKKHIELELACYLAGVETYADFRTLNERILSSKQWRKVLTKAEKYNINVRPFTTAPTKDTLAELRKLCKAAEAEAEAKARLEQAEADGTEVVIK